MPINFPSKSLKPMDVFQENKYQGSDQWKNGNTPSFDTNFPSKGDKMDARMAPHPPVCFDPSQRRVNIWGDHGPSISQRNDVGSWNQPDSRFPSENTVAHVGQQGPTVLPGMWMPNISNLQVASWNNTFGVIPNENQDTHFPITLQGTFMTPVNALLGFSLPRQRCKDFEEQGYCLRGETCPMEHGLNRIVIEDVQFNHPFSISSANLRRKYSIPRHPSHTIIIPTMNDNGVNNASKKGTVGACSNDVHGVDSYDPDQPLWTKLESPTLPLVQMSKFNQAESMLEDCSALHMGKAAYNGQIAESSIISENEKLSVWDRFGCSKGEVEDKDKVHSATDPEINTKDSESKTIDFCPKVRNDTIRFPRKQNQKADRTLFVNRIPQQVKKMEPLLSHFKKFGEVVHVYIPVNSDHAFIQFSKQEEAEAALTAPDAVMGNRFIELRWAHHDCITGGGITAKSNAHGPRTSSVASDTKFISCSRKDSLHHVSAKAKIIQNPAVSLPDTDKSKSMTTNYVKALHPLKNNLTSLEQLKKELQQKQKMLDQKRQDFKQQLEKLDKQSTGIKCEVMASRAKRQKLVSAPDCGILPMSISSDRDSVVPPSCSSTDAVVQGSQCFKHPISPSSTFINSFTMNRFQLDHRPTAFKIIPPLPGDLANGDSLKEHFSSYGDVSMVQCQTAVNGTDGCSRTMTNCSALIKFTTRESAEKAFANGKCWKGHFLQFLWEKKLNESLAPSNEPQISPSADR